MKASISNISLFMGFLSLLFGGISATKTQAQCTVTAYANPITINCGDTVDLSALGDQGTVVYSNDFNGACPGPGWVATSSATCSNPCGNGPSGLPGDPYLWMGSTATAPRNVTTLDFNVNNGGTICFDMRYASEEACPGPGTCAPTSLTCSCEGPDLPDEGVHLQYSLNAGGTWTDIQYWDPNGGCDPALINWTNRCVTIPLAAYSVSTRFRWYQIASSDSNSDHWGIDNVSISVPNLSFLYDWTHDAQAPSSSAATPPVVPTSNTTYTVNYSDGTTSCFNTVNVVVNTPTVSALGGGTFCEGDAVQLSSVSNLVITTPTVCSSTTDVGCPANNSQAQEYQVGAGATVSNCNSSQPEYFGDFGAWSVRDQIIYHASELNTAFSTTDGRKLSSISFDFDHFINGGNCSGPTANSGTYNNFTVKIGCTSKTQFATGFGDWENPANLTTVYGPVGRNFVAGWNTIDFVNLYDWDGSSNIIIEICFNTGSQQGYVRQHTTSFRSGYTDQVNSDDPTQCADDTWGGDWTLRPNTRFGVCEPVPGISYAWTPSLTLDDDTIPNPIATPLGTTIYTLNVTPTGAPAACAASDTVQVTIIPGPPVNVSGGSCSNGSTNLIANGESFCNTTATAPVEHNSNTLVTRCITVSGVTPNAYPAALLSTFVDITHNDINEVSNSALTNATIEIQGPGMGGWTTLTGLTSGDNVWLGALPAGAGTPAGGSDVNGTWCIRYLDNCVGCGPLGVNDNGGATYSGFCMNFNQGNNTGVTYAWTPSGGLNTTTGQSVVTTSSPALYTVTATNASGCSTTMNFTVPSCGAVLPTETLFFDANIIGENVKLTWATTTEINNDYFTIERSEDGKFWNEFAVTKGAGNSNEYLFYSEIDYEPSIGINYYRLKQTDFDGEYEYSSIASVNFEKLEEIKIYPNPNNGHFTINGEINNAQMIIFNIVGEKVYEDQIDSISKEEKGIRVNLSGLSSGIYFVNINSEKSNIVQKISINK
jgi:hypothetical protein